MEFKGISSIIKAHLSVMSSEADRPLSDNQRAQIPQVKGEELSSLLRFVTPILKSEPNILDLFSPVIVVGSLHGSLVDLYQILSRFGLPPTRSYCFLGNIIGAGEFSLETATFILALKAVYPRNIFVLRGKGEFEGDALKHGFAEEVAGMYSDEEMLNLFLEAFSFLPVAAVFFNSIFCVPGGITPDLKDISQINNMPKKDNEIAFGLMNSRPSLNTLSFATTNRGFSFGLVSFEKFMEQNAFSLMVRGRDYLNDGYHLQFANRLVSIFSASNFKGSNNSCGVIALFGKDDYKMIKLKSLPNIKRGDVSFVDIALFDSMQQRKLETLSIPRAAAGVSSAAATTTRKTAMRILETSRNSIPTGHPILTICNGSDKLQQIARVRTFGTSRVATLAKFDTFL